jgi:hypothetical protein
MDILGFDYDYTLASYTDRVQHFIYSNALRWLIEVQNKISKEFGSAAI